ncbi:MAG: 16S rRNA (cytidine(1402)-2'-O)-methyltransferase [Actinomycetes bacterium]
MSAASGGVLVVAATPIGDVDDAAPRLAAELARADVIAAEDTRRFARLRAALGVDIPGRVVSYFDGNEARRTTELLAELEAGARVVLVTDAGMPAISDPGYRLVAAALDAGLTVTAVAGPSAVTTALAVSGLAVDRFCFEGFLPRRTGERARRLQELAAEPRTMVFFESPRRVAATLAALASAFGSDRLAAVCRELTKTHEEVRRASLGELCLWAADEVRGEVTLVVAGASHVRRVPDDRELAAAVDERVAAGASRRTAIDAVAAELGLPRRHVYAAATRKSDGGASLG